MKIQRMALKNFRCFADYEIEFADKFNLLIGNNASGKTAILDAMAVGLGPLVKEMSTTPVPSLNQDDLRKIFYKLGQDLKSEQPKSAVISFNCTSHDPITHEEIQFSWIVDFMLNKMTSIGDIKEVGNNFYCVVTEGSPVVLPIIAYYGTERIWKLQKKLEIETNPPGSRFEGYNGCFDPSSRLIDLFSFLKKYEFVALQKNESRHTLEAVKNAITGCIEDAENAWWDIEKDEFLIDITIKGQPRQELPFSLLSDGYRNMLAMVGDMAYRAAVLNPHLGEGAAAETPGVVLIDEIDLHLHPAWQMNVIRNLMHTFPSVQYMATTHSPFMIQSLYGEEGVQVWDLAKSGPVAMDTMSIEDIVEEAQGVEVPQRSRRYQEMMTVAEKYYKLLEKAESAESEELKKLKEQLDQLSERFSDDVAYHAYLKMRRQAAGLGED